MVPKANLVAFYSEAAPITVRVDCESRVSATRGQKKQRSKGSGAMLYFPNTISPLLIIVEPS